MDFNFFEPYLNAPAKSNTKRNLLILLIVLAIGVMAYYQWMLLDQSRALGEEINEIDAYVQSEKISDKKEEILSKQNYDKALEATYNSIKSIDDQIESANVVEVDLIEKINAKVPDNIFLSNLKILKGAINFTGYSADYSALSQLVFNIREMEEVDYLSIPTINELEENLSFSVNGTLLEEGLDENQ